MEMLEEFWLIRSIYRMFSLLETIPRYSGCQRRVRILAGRKGLPYPGAILVHMLDLQT